LPMSEGKPRHGWRFLDLDLGLLAGARALPFPGKSSPGRGDRGSLSLAGGNWPPRTVASGPRSSADLDRLRSVCGRIPAVQHQCGRSPPPEGASRPEWGLRRRGKFHGPPRKDKDSATAVFPQGRRPSPSHRLSDSRSSSTPLAIAKRSLGHIVCPRLPTPLERKSVSRLTPGAGHSHLPDTLPQLSFQTSGEPRLHRPECSRFPDRSAGHNKTIPRDRRVHFSTEFFWK